MSSSLQDLLAQEGFRRRKPSQHAKPTKPQGSRRRRSSPSSEPAAATPSPASLCRDRRSVDLSGGPRRPHRHSHPDGSPGFAKPSSAAGSNPRSRAAAATGGASSWGGGDGEPEVRAVVSILSGYVGRFSSEAEFRRQVRERSSACLAARRKGAAHAVLVNLEMGMEGIERLAEKDGYLGEGDARDSKIRSLRNSIRLLTIVASVNSPKSRNGYTCGVPNSYLSACAQLYLSIVYRMEGDDWVAARHLLQVFCDAPYLARKNLLPDLWEHFFLPHLLHLEVWFNEEAEMASGLDAGHDRERRTKWLSRVYNDQMDLGTAQFALYYKEWLKAGARAPVAPLVSLPHVPSCWSVAPKRSVSLSPCSVNRNLYQAVFGPSYESKGSEDGALPSLGGVEVEREAGSEEGICKNGNYVHSDSGVRKRLLHHAKETPITESVSTRRKSYSFLLLSCRGDPNKGAIRHSHLPKNGIVENLEIAKESNLNVPLLDLGQAITLMSTSDNLSECEYAIRVIAKVWLDANGDPIVETALSTASVIEGLLEVSFTSKDEEVVELTISILAELVARSEVNKQVVLNADPQLEIFLKLLRVHSLFLKVAVLLFLLKPKAKQMLSLDWVPIVLRILEYGDQRQTLFTVQCRPKSAAFYFLDQLLKGFDVDRNVENGKQVVAFGGLRLLIRRLELGDARERKNVASLLVTCVRADGSCREYLATNVKKTSILELLIGNQLKSSGSALSLLLELVRLRRTQVTMFLNNLKNEGCLNAMHILLVLLQRAPDEQRPLVAAILLQLDLLLYCREILCSSVYIEKKGLMP
uniref:Putative E3 ubiquitin-protein ligase LIN n=1 Tax=Anthurium amnicola TaxID=1678845 RepID=A0A1D1ZLR9_9ARAE